jgi:hypothetical protein
MVNTRISRIGLFRIFYLEPLGQVRRWSIREGRGEEYDIGYEKIALEMKSADNKNSSSSKKISGSNKDNQLALRFKLDQQNYNCRTQRFLKLA